MRIPVESSKPLSSPLLLKDAQWLVRQYGMLDEMHLMKVMAVSAKKAADVQHMYKQWSTLSNKQIATIDAFVGDIYSGLQVQSWSDDDREYAHKHLLILSGLYGALRACDGVMPYRLEMGYKLPDGSSLYAFWGDKIANVVDVKTTSIVNLSAVEYTKALLPYLNQQVITPKFLTLSPKTGEPVFVTVHAKIARGAFAKWLIAERIDDLAQLPLFTDLNYRYSKTLSAPEQPVFVAQTFGGIGLSVRLT